MLLLVLAEAVGTAEFLATNTAPMGLPGRVLLSMLVQVLQGDELGVALAALVEVGLPAAPAAAGLARSPHISGRFFCVLHFKLFVLIIQTC